MAGKKSYKTLLMELDALRGESGASAHKRIQIAIKVYDDPDFLADEGILDQIKAAEVLNQKFDDLGLLFSELRNMYKAFPNVADWEDGKLRTLLERTLDLAEANKPEPTKRSVTRVTNKDYEQLEEKMKDFEARLVYANRTVDETKSEMDRLRDENLALRNEKMRLEGRIEELEKLLTPQLA